jgi:hypothetical protein
VTGHRIRLGKGFKLKAGKPERSDQHLDVSAKLRRKASRRIRVARKGQAR